MYSDKLDKGPILTQPFLTYKSQKHVSSNRRHFTNVIEDYNICLLHISQFFFLFFKYDIKKKNVSCKHAEELTICSYIHCLYCIHIERKVGWNILESFPPVFSANKNFLKVSKDDKIVLWNVHTLDGYCNLKCNSRPCVHTAWKEVSHLTLLLNPNPNWCDKTWSPYLKAKLLKKP